MIEATLEPRLAIGPLNVASQGTAWAKAVRHNLRAEAAAYGFDGGIARLVKRSGKRVDDRVDYSIPHYRLSPQWVRASALAYALRGCTHVLNEGNTPTIGDPRARRFTDEVEWYRERGLAPAIVFHGSDIRDPDISLENDEHSYFRHVSPELVERLRRRSHKNREAVMHQGMPLYVSTPDLLAHIPHSRLLPLTVDVEAWAGMPQAFSGPIPRVLHRPSGTNPYVKGTDIIRPILEEFERRRMIEIVSSPVVAHSQMRNLYERADIVVDQIRIGAYGVTAVEAMASGRVVIANVSHDKEARDRNPPVLVHATPDTFHDALSELLGDLSAAQRMARDGRAYAREMHDGARAAKALDPFLFS
ncbi:hypothetical protein [Agrococcus sp. DT81.2]|uniref:hypothetical protein n=1 Tax=Agrococcus sp. DT81.2 TaxID=3393414 RepID=UPI003CE59F86